MGCSELTPVVKGLMELLGLEWLANLHQLCEGKVLGIDGHALLHRAASIPDLAHSIIFDEDYGPAADLFVLWCTQLRSAGIDLRVIFDGAVMPGKRGEKAERLDSSRSRGCGSGAAAVAPWLHPGPGRRLERLPGAQLAPLTPLAEAAMGSADGGLCVCLLYTSPSPRDS